MLQAHPDLKPFRVISYRLLLSPAGAPTGLQAVQIRASARRITPDLPRADLGLRVNAGSAAAIQRGPCWLSVTSAGREVARLSMADPDRSIDARRLQQIRAAIPGLAKGQCG